ncbi:hydroxymethylglutaryl-CoA lyase ['Osedax' symbiont bacterium Rs2_46_30_T18]|nr:hydroxymethylglutaryl-CoA lyase ['Osedax' symbiont bacterium Rs2_46_30_T18]
MSKQKVKIVEVGPRDGLQNETAIISSQTKIDLINRLADAGLAHIEAASFVSPRWVPQMADAEQVMRGYTAKAGVSYSALVPNLKGLENAIEAGVQEIAVFTAASEAFCQKNINCSVAQSLKRFTDIMALASDRQIKVRGYVSTVLGCPYQGEVSLAQVSDVSSTLYEMGCYEISLGDTIGVGTADKVEQLIRNCQKTIPLEDLAVHFHDSYGQGLVNIYAALSQGIRTVDTSISGLGGCPYANGATGNVATEDVVYMLHGLGYETDIDLNKLVAAGHWISDQLQRINGSKTGLAMNKRR